MHMDIQITVSDLREKKLFSFTNSAVAKTQRFKNRVAIGAGFPCIPTIKKGRGRGGGCLSEEDTYLGTYSRH